MGYGPPEIDDLEAVFQQLWRLICWEMFVDAGDGGFVRLVAVDLGGGLSLLGAVINLIWATAADRFR